MSAIAGLLRHDGRDVDRRDLERMANALRPYGPDRSQIVAAGPIGMAHALMRITAEDSFDHQPWRSPHGRLISADVRLDNRDDILERMGVTAESALAWPDSRVVLFAWEKFGDAIWRDFRGPFAVAIWDPSQRTLTLARDPIGLNVVMWCRCKDFFAFASMPKGLFALADVPRELNVEKFADFLVLNHADLTATFYRDIYRLAPAHVAKVAINGAMTEHRFWSVADVRPIMLSSDQAYAEGLRDVLDRAVRRQMRSVAPIGCCLSGGLDSSSVAALAARALAEKNLRLPAFTHTPRRAFDAVVAEGAYADETPYVEAIRRRLGNVDVTYVRNDECDDFAELDRFFLAFEGPVRNVTNLGWLLAIPRLARKQGVRVLLGGDLGNLTVSWNGWSQTVEHLLRLRLRTAYRQWRLFYTQSNYSRWTALRKLIVAPLLPLAVGDWLDRRRRSETAGPWREYSTIRPDFAAAAKVDARARQMGHDFLFRPRLGQRAGAFVPTDYGGDWLAAVKAVTGVEMRDPTADLDVVAYCYGVPPEQFLAEGVDRSLIRRAMWGLLPKAVLTNRMRGVQSADWYEKLGKQRRTLSQWIADAAASPSAGEFIDLPRLSRAISEWPAGGWDTRGVIDEYHHALSRGVAAAKFLTWLEATNLGAAVSPSASRSNHNRWRKEQ